MMFASQSVTSYTVYIMFPQYLYNENHAASQHVFVYESKCSVRGWILETYLSINDGELRHNQSLSGGHTQ